MSFYSEYFTSTFALTLLGFIFCAYVTHQSRKRKKLPPGPYGLPFLGCIPYLSQHAEHTFSQWSKVYGPVIYTKIGSNPTLILNSFEAIHQAFVVQANQFSNRYHTFFSNYSCEGGHGIIFLHPYSAWKVQKNFGTRALTGKGLGGETIETRILKEVELLLDKIKHKNEEPFILEDDLLVAIANVLVDIVMKEYCDKQQNSKLLEYIFESVKSIRKSAYVFYAISMFPWSRFIPPIKGEFEKMKKGMKNANELCFEIIDRHLKNSKFNEPRDFVDLFLKEYHQNTPGFTMKQLVYYLKDLISGGVDTTTSSIRWMCMCLVKYPDVQETIHEEIDNVLGPDGKVSLACDLPYTKAFIQEALRVSTVIPLGVPHATVEDLWFMGYFVPKNTQVLANVWHVHNDPTHWPDPSRFDPSRHLDSKGRFVKSDKVLAFSTGPRSCLGETLARKELFLFLVSIMQKFQVLGNAEQPVPNMQGAPGIITSPYPYKFVMKMR